MPRETAVKKSELIRGLVRHIDFDGLADEFPGLTRAGLRRLLDEAADAVGAGAAGGTAGGPRTAAGRVVLHTDGASRGNPGEAGIGVLVCDEAGAALKRIARYIGRATNNQAEYRAVIEGLGAARGLGAREVSVCADSELVVRQLNGVYRVKNPGLKALHAEAESLLAGFARSVVKYVPRQENVEADALANKAIDGRLR